MIEAINNLSKKKKIFKEIQTRELNYFLSCLIILLYLFSLSFVDVDVGVEYLGDFRNISLLRRFLSIDKNPGPVINKLIIIARYNKSNSNPSINPFDNFTDRIAPIISIASSPAAILVKKPNKITKPPMNSNSPIKIAKSEGKPIFIKEP